MKIFTAASLFLTALTLFSFKLLTSCMVDAYNVLSPQFVGSINLQHSQMRMNYCSLANANVSYQGLVSQHCAFFYFRVGNMDHVAERGSLQKICFITH